LHLKGTTWIYVKSKVGFLTVDIFGLSVFFLDSFKCMLIFGGNLPIRHPFHDIWLLLRLNLRWNLYKSSKRFYLTYTAMENYLVVLLLQTTVIHVVLIFINLSASHFDTYIDKNLDFVLMKKDIVLHTTNANNVCSLYCRNKDRQIVINLSFYLNLIKHRTKNNT
jgi:hypothetical protein